MKIKRFEFNMFPVNCYVLWDETKEAVVIDPGCFYEEEKQVLKKFILSNELNVKHLLNTSSTLGITFSETVHAQRVRSVGRSKPKRMNIGSTMHRSKVGCLVFSCRKPCAIGQILA